MSGILSNLALGAGAPLRAHGIFWNKIGSSKTRLASNPVQRVRWFGSKVLMVGSKGPMVGYRIPMVRSKVVMVGSKVPMISGCRSLPNHAAARRQLCSRATNSSTSSNPSATSGLRNRSIVYYTTSIVLVVGGLSYAAVPLYRIFCSAQGLGGQATLLGEVIEDAGDKVEAMKPVAHREIKVNFQADTSSGMRWNFRPQQAAVRVRPGETVLAFYSARNPNPEPVDGIATYNVIPFEAGKYFNKIQCFCFEEQRLNPGEEVDMPVFFYIDPEYAEDPKLENIHQITLAYTFFEAKPGLQLPFPKIT